MHSFANKDSLRWCFTNKETQAPRNKVTRPRAYAGLSEVPVLLLYPADLHVMVHEILTISQLGHFGLIMKPHSQSSANLEDLQVSH